MFENYCLKPYLHNIDTLIFKKALKNSLFLPGTLLCTPMPTATILQLLDYNISAYSKPGIKLNTFLVYLI